MTVYKVVNDTTNKLAGTFFEKQLAERKRNKLNLKLGHIAYSVLLSDL